MTYTGGIFHTKCCIKVDERNYLANFSF